MKFISTTILIASISGFVHSQTFDQVSDGHTFKVIYQSAANKNSAIDGSPFFNDDWSTGLIYTDKDKSYKIEKMQYNIYLNEIHFLQNDVAYSLNNDVSIIKFKLEEYEFLNIDNKYYQLLCKGEKLSLLKFYSCNIIAGKPSNGMIPATNDKFEVQHEYYAQFKNGEIIKFQNKKDNLLQLLNDNGEIKAFLKKNKIKLKTDNEIVEVFEYYNQ